jgi:hypothetical protein
MTVWGWFSATARLFLTSSSGLDREAVDQIFNAAPFGFGGEAHGHAVGEGWTRQGENIVDRGGQTAAQERARARCEQQG